MRANKARVDAVESAILGILSKPVSFEEALAALCDAFGLALDLPRYVLVGSTLRSFLAFLGAEGKARFSFEGNRMLWSTGNEGLAAS